MLFFARRKYGEKITSIFEATFGHKLSAKVHSPLEKCDHPELNSSEFLDTEEIKKYQSLIGTL